MAISATIAIDDSTLALGQSATLTLTISNSGSAAVAVTGIVPKCYIDGASPAVNSVSVALGKVSMAPGQDLSIPATGGGDLLKTFGFTPLGPTSGEGLAAPSSLVYALTADIYTADGSITTPDVVTCTVTAPSWS